MIPSRTAACALLLLIAAAQSAAQGPTRAFTGLTLAVVPHLGQQIVDRHPALEFGQAWKKVVPSAEKKPPMIQRAHQVISGRIPSRTLTLRACVCHVHGRTFMTPANSP